MDYTEEARHTLEVERGNFEQIPHWLLFHDRVTPNAIRLYLILRSYAMGSGVAFPSRKTLADAMCVSLPTLDAAKRNLVEVGGVIVQGRTSSNGDQTSNLYRVLWEERNLTGSKEIEVTPPKDLSDPLLRNLDRKTDVFQADKPKQTRVQKPVNLEGDPLFAEFWDTYPRREGKGAARSAWLRAIRKTEPATIIEGAKRYRDDKNRVQAYTAHPGTWLNGERWDDEPLPAGDKQEPERPATYMDLITDEPCEHGEPRGVEFCPMCRRTK